MKSKSPPKSSRGNVKESLGHLMDALLKTESEIKMQVNPSYIYKANYPIRIFNRNNFLKTMKYYIFS